MNLAQDLFEFGFILQSRKDIHDQMPESGKNINHALPRILVAHEDVGTLRLLRETLENFSPCRVDTTPNAQYAFELALQRDYQLFMFGLALPIIQGELLYSLLVKAVPLCHGGDRNCPGVIYIAERKTVNTACGRFGGFPDQGYF